MSLTHDNLKTLQRPFKPDEHEFLKELTYIREDAITARIEEVDPAWELTGLGITHRNTFANDVQVTVIVRLTICGVSREGVGSAKVIGKTGTWEGKYPNKKFIPLPPEEHSEVNEAEKSAATDALKRAARLFGIGRYLLSLPEWVTNEETLAKHLNGSPSSTSQRPTTPPKTGDNASKGATTSAAQETSKMALSEPSGASWWTDKDQIAYVKENTGMTLGLASSKIGRNFNEFATAPEFVAAYRELAPQ